MAKFSENEYLEMVKLAYQVQQKAYVPYSNWQVGACLVDSKGNKHLGCNIENSTYTPTNCAERTAFFKAISDGETTFSAIAVVGNDKDSFDTTDFTDFCPPCGVCRQVMVEFCDLDTFEVVLGKKQKGEIAYEVYLLKDLMPHMVKPPIAKK